MEKRIKRLRKIRFILGQLLLTTIFLGIFTKFVTSGNPETVKFISNAFMDTSFILFSTNLIITICIQSIQLQSRTHSSIYREGKKRRTA